MKKFVLLGLFCWYVYILPSNYEEFMTFFTLFYDLFAKKFLSLTAGVNYKKTTDLASVEKGVYLFTLEE